ncbi:UDP-N-acetylglucosamine 2-epimerase (non-hydrolyzing) [Heliorestis acidaminivorans]|uniref:UDP-N-acetylglucosamine 2-epimerase (non-hydrolyzing) n=1 Tax=Heliorestis acidaminivorans TaxID=553427 RepID=A0A6I0F1K3_9FIRM|nr:UDP-N-acetylglucosamine 2-epimerase (non-hydrolyzing) [Heliorestis acidaminivorans]KAB2953811.1 UDP-N-acetylglucosamine 2-epimerase (non-hydrolyzing) [Heliorestis acidaminivorans]
MPKPIKVLSIFGTRPEAIKMAPVVKELERTEQIISKVAVTAQHREMLDQVLGLFDIQPDYDLNIMAPEQTLYDITAKALLGLKPILEQEKPDIVLVHGDTTTTFIASLASYYQQIAVGHVEAGLRTHNKYSPFPEEMNRKLTGSLSDMHFAPTGTSRENLLDEAVDPEAIYVTGNTVIDALLATVRPDYTFADPNLQQIVQKEKEILLVTTHRRENLGEPMRQVYQALREVLAQRPQAFIIFPVHKNPAVRRVVEEELGQHPRVQLIEPMDYEPFVNLMNQATIILTDSGGMQEEAPSLGKPVLVLRDTTERPEAVRAGTVKLVGTSATIITNETLTLLKNPEAYKAMANAVNPYGDGKASQRIAQAILYHFRQSDQLPDEYGLV